MTKRAYIYAPLLLALLLALTSCHTPAPSNPLPNLEAKFELPNLSGQLAMFTLVRQALSLYPDMRRILKLPKDPDIPNICDRPIIVSIFHENGPPLWGVSSQGCLHESILRAVFQITQDPNFRKYYLLNLDKVAVRFDIVITRQRLEVTRKNISKVVVEPGVNGLILQNGDKLTYQPPFAFNAYSWEREWSGSPRVARVKAQLQYLAQAADIGKNNWDNYPIYRFRTAALLQHRPDFLPLPLFRDSPIINRFGSREIGRAAVDAGRYLNKTFNRTNQRFRYKFNPITLEKNGYFDYNTVRHAGTIYSLMRLYKASRRDEFIPLIQDSMEFLLRHTQAPLLEPDLLCVERNYLAQLGSSALMLTALCELPDMLLARIGIQRINRLARFLVEMQEDDGRFYDFYWERLIGYMPRKSEQYFAGEALLALVRYYAVNPNVEWLAAARLAAQRQILDFEETGQPDNWTIQGLAELFEADPDPHYADQCFAMADKLLKEQWGNPAMGRAAPSPDYVGGFSGSTPPRLATAASRVEALLAAHRLAFQLNRDPQTYADAIMSATRFILQNQYRRDNDYYIHLPDEVRGGFRAGLVDPMIQMDSCEHAIIALAGAYDIAYMRETGEVPTELRSEGTRELQDELEPGAPTETQAPRQTPTPKKP